MRLRIYRTFSWRNESKTLGGPAQWALDHHDELQYESHGAWKPIDIVEAFKPEHPEQSEEFQEQQKLSKAICDFVINDMPRLVR